MRWMVVFIAGVMSLIGGSIMIGLDGLSAENDAPMVRAESGCAHALASPQVFDHTPVSLDERGCMATGAVFEVRAKPVPGGLGTQYAQAIDSLNRQTSIFGEPTVRQRALWSMGWVAFRSGDFQSARGVFRYLEREAPFGRQAPAAIYWAARAAGELGDQVAYRSELTALIKRFPVDYYSTQAMARLEEIPDEGFEVPAARLSEAPLGTRAVLARALIDVGARAEASRVLNMALLEERDAMSPAEYAALRAVAVELGSRYFETRFRWEATKRYPETNSTTVRSLSMMFPWDYVRVVQRAAQRKRVDSTLAIGLARQESAFNPRALSRAGAQGLMQLMPQTASDLVGRGGEAVPELDIYNPELNADLGTTYVRQLLALYDGEVERALAAYNAGPGAVARWNRRLGEVPADVFVEEIPYHETRNYVRAVLSWQRKYEYLQAARVLLLDQEKRAAVKDLSALRQG
ncbi:MAG: lytic transglycosylase domain-containing protein [Myxococcota bacterium]|nr:lytic transglycosylase domain-containing protein [Myxococcota bacterium]